MKKIIILFMFWGAFFGDSVVASDGYPAGSLLKPNNDSSAVYYIGEDGKKYVFPDSKTYFTWFENFDDVIKVDIAELSKYKNGGIMPYKAGTRLITHRDTAKIYAVEPDGVLRQIPNEEVAINLYGNAWTSLVQDVLPGYFMATYTVGSELDDELPTGTIVKDGDIFYYIENGLKRRFVSEEAFRAYNFRYDYVLNVNDLAKYEDGEEISSEIDIVSSEDDVGSEYSDYDFKYTLKYSAELAVAIRMDGATDRDLELREINISSLGPIFINYDNYSYRLRQASVQGSKYEYAGEPISLSNFDSVILINAGDSNDYPVFDLSDWVIWDNTVDKQVFVK